MNATVRRIATPVIVGTGLALVIGTGAALAYYRSNIAATGSGSAQTAAAATVTMTVTGTVSTNLYPGGPGATVTVNVTNPYSSPITLTGVVANGTIVVTPATAGCTLANSAVALTAPTAMLPDNSIAGGATETVDLVGAVTMGISSDTRCQGAAFAVPFTIAGKL